MGFITVHCCKVERNLIGLLFTNPDFFKGHLTWHKVEWHHRETCQVENASLFFRGFAKTSFTFGVQRNWLENICTLKIPLFPKVREIITKRSCLWNAAVARCSLWIIFQSWKNVQFQQIFKNNGIWLWNSYTRILIKERFSRYKLSFLSPDRLFYDLFQLWFKSKNLAVVMHFIQNYSQCVCFDTYFPWLNFPVDRETCS